MILKLNKQYKPLKTTSNSISRKMRKIELLTKNTADEELANKENALVAGTDNVVLDRESEPGKTIIKVASESGEVILKPDTTVLVDGARLYLSQYIQNTGTTDIRSAINTFDANVIGSWTDGGKYTGTVKSAIESLAAISMFKVVETLPTTGETNTIYILKPAGKTEGPYEEYIWVDNKWEKIGDTDIQLENYYKKDEIGGAWSDTNTLSAYVDTQDNALDARLDTVEGKLVGLPEGKTIQQAIDAEATRAGGVEGALSDLTTTTKDNLVAAINEINATAVQTATDDDYISASVSGTALSVGVKTGSKLEDILTICSFTTEEE